MPDVYDRFKEVTQNISKLTGKRLFRSSAPNYQWLGPGKDSDSTQWFDFGAQQFLEQKSIKAIVSLNEYHYSVKQADWLNMLDDAGCTYLHRPVDDFTSPTIADFEAAINFLQSAPNGSVLTHCGYGEGRTGTLICAIQLWSTGGVYPTKEEIQNDINGIEKYSQKATLEEYRKKLQQH